MSSFNFGMKNRTFENLKLRDERVEKMKQFKISDTVLIGGTILGIVVKKDFASGIMSIRLQTGRIEKFAPDHMEKK